METNGRAILNLETKQVVELQAASRDIHARETVELEMEQNEQRLRAVIDSAPFDAHLYELKPGGRLIFTGANRLADQMQVFMPMPANNCSPLSCIRRG